MRPFFSLVVLTLAVIATDSATAANKCRTCGTGPMAFLTPQGHRGADFRPACSRHDTCYDRSGKSRRQCDRELLQEMQAACACSDNPRACQRRARMMNAATRLFGWTQYKP